MPADADATRARAVATRLVARFLVRSWSIDFLRTVVEAAGVERERSAIMN
jgi:hypothetical protein